MIEKIVLNAPKHVDAIWAPDNFLLGCHGWLNINLELKHLRCILYTVTYLTYITSCYLN